MHIVSLGKDDATVFEPMARLLVEGFRGIAPDAWASLENAEQEVREAFDVGFCRAAVDDSDKVLGWVGGRHAYGLVWELHPLVVDPGRQGEGIGRALVLDFEAQVRERGGLTVLLGTDDEADHSFRSGFIPEYGEAYHGGTGKTASCAGILPGARVHPDRGCAGCERDWQTRYSDGEAGVNMIEHPTAV